MVEILELPAYIDMTRLVKTIQSKASGCGFPGHWILKEPCKSNRYIYLRPTDIGKRKSRKALVRRVLYYINYHGLPLKQITMICAERAETEEERQFLQDHCINPAHMRIRGWEPEANNFIERQIEKGYLHPDDAAKWFDWSPSKEFKMPDIEKRTDYDIMNILEKE